MFSFHLFVFSIFLRVLAQTVEEPFFVLCNPVLNNLFHKSIFMKKTPIPFPVREFQVQDVSCACSDLAYLEFEKEHAFAASQIEKFWKESHFPPLASCRGDFN